MNKVTNPGIVISGTNENGPFKMVVDCCFRLPNKGRPVLTGKVTEGRMWPNNEIKIDFENNKQTLYDHVSEIEMHKKIYSSCKCW